MRRVAWHSSFRRAFEKQTRRDPHLRERILEALRRLADDLFDPQLRTHNLRGQLDGLWACRVEHDLRIVFALEPDPAGPEDMIVLIDLGSHDEVY